MTSRQIEERFIAGVRAIEGQNQEIVKKYDIEVSVPNYFSAGKPLKSYRGKIMASIPLVYGSVPAEWAHGPTSNPDAKILTDIEGAILAREIAKRNGVMLDVLEYRYGDAAGPVFNFPFYSSRTVDRGIKSVANAKKTFTAAYETLGKKRKKMVKELLAESQN